MPKNLYLIDRGHDRPSQFHPDTPYHRVLVACNGKVARHEAGDTGDGATVWQLFAGDLDGSGWLLIRWKGLDVDYGSLVRTWTLPDGSHTAFYHPGRPEPGTPVGNWLDRLVADPLLGPTARAVASDLFDYREDGGDTCCPSDAQIGKDVGKSVGHVQRCLKDLEDSGWIVREKTDEEKAGRRIRLTTPPPAGQSIIDPWELLEGAIWWSTKPLPPNLASAGVVLSPDSLTDTDLRTHREIEECESFVLDKLNDVRSLGYRYTLDLDRSNREGRSPRERQLLLIP
jgi:DNA-binding MarR family transcriptional regulator